MGKNSLTLCGAFLSAFLGLILSAPVRSADLVGNQTFTTTAITLSESSAPVLTAQANARGADFNPTILPTDLTPLSRSAESALLSRQIRFAIMKKLPTRLWFNLTTEVSQRYESNVFFTYSHHKGDYAFRVLPNITIGYNVLPHTSVYCNYFVIKDQFAVHDVLSIPTTQSLALGVRHDLPVGRKTSLQFDFQARELWQSRNLHQADFLPSVSVTHVVRPRTYLFGSLLLQLRGRDYFVAPTREIDPFYTIGLIHQRGQWTFSATDTMVTNFRSPPFRTSIPRQGNVSMIADFEVAHPVTRKIPGLVAFIRAEPVWNWSSHKRPGLSGFDIRIFGGLRLSVNKQSYLSTIENLRQQLIESEGDQGRPAPKKKTPSSSEVPETKPVATSQTAPAVSQ